MFKKDLVTKCSLWGSIVFLEVKLTLTLGLKRDPIDQVLVDLRR